MSQLYFKLHFNQKHLINLLCIVTNACVDLEDVIADEPDQVGEVGHGRLVDHELQHGLLHRTISTLYDDCSKA